MTRTGTASALIGAGSAPGALEDVSRSHALVGDRLQVVPPNLSGLFIAAGGFASSASDLGRFLTMLARGGELDGRRILLVGDLLHSRVFRSVSTVARKLGMEVGIFGPATLVPAGRPDYMRTFATFEEAIAWAPDFVYLLRLQSERQAAHFFPSLREYHQVFGLTRERLAQCRRRGIHIMHPGPVNRGVELVDEVLSYEHCLINRQVENGIAARMAVLYCLQPATTPLPAEEETPS
jgi:aspartate carbamoyltransferase catalytic subunit